MVEFANFQDLLRCSPAAGRQVPPVPPAHVPPAPLLAARCEARAWAALDGLLVRGMRHWTLGAALAAWLKHIVEQRQARREAFFDAMGSQMCAATRRCGWMEKRSGKEALVLALVVWRGEVDFRCLWRSRQRAIDRTRRHCFMDARRSAAWSMFWAWHHVTRTLRATTSHAPQQLPTLLRGIATQVQYSPEKPRKHAWLAQTRSISCPRFCYNMIGFQDKSSSQKLVSTNTAATVSPDSTRTVAGSGDAYCSSVLSGSLAVQPIAVFTPDSSPAPKLASGITAAAIFQDSTGNVAVSHDASCNTALSDGLALQLSAALASNSSLAAAALAVADLNTRQDEVAGGRGRESCSASPVRNRRISLQSKLGDSPMRYTRLGDSPMQNTSIGYGCGSSPSQFRLKWAEISVTDATRDGGAATSPLPRGPERLFYDVSSYTGRAKYGGPPRLDRRSTLFAARTSSYRDNAARLRKHSAASMVNATTAMASGRHGSP